MAGSVPPPPAGDSPDLLGALQESLNRGVAPSPQAVERALKMQAGSVLAREVLRLREIEQRARLVAEGRPVRTDRHVANALSVTGGPSPYQASVTADWILNGPEVSS